MDNPAFSRPNSSIIKNTQQQVNHPDDDAVFADSSVPKTATKLADEATIAGTHQRYIQNRSLQGNTVAPVNAPVWMTSLPMVQQRNTATTMPVRMEKPKDDGDVEAVAPRLPVNWAFISYWLTKKQMSLFLFREENMIRQFCAAVVEWWVFEYLVLMAIIINVIVMTLDRTQPRNDQAPITAVLEQTELPFVIFFTIEAVFKIISQGFLFNRKSYLRDGWNIIDFIVVVSGLLTVIFTQIDLSFLRTLRILRPLKLLTRIRPLRVILQAILTAMVPLSQIALILGFVIAIFAVIGMQFYTGVFHWTCFDRETGDIVAEGDPKPCAADSTTGRGANICPPNAVCRRFWLGPLEGLISFDNIGLAMLTVFQCVTTEGWSEMMYLTDGVYGKGLNWIYFCLLIVVGTFFMLNLVLGVLSAEFAKERGRVEKRRAYMRKHRQEIFQRELSSYLEWITRAENIILNDPDVEQTVKLRVITQRRENELKAKRKGSRFSSRFRSTVSMTSLPSSGGFESTTGNDDVFADETGTQQQPGAEMQEDPAKIEARRRLQRLTGFQRFRRALRRFIKSQAFFWIVIIFVVLNTITLGIEFYNMPGWLDQALYYFAIIFAVVFCLEIAIKILALGFDVFFQSKQNIFETVIIAGSVLELILQSFNPDWAIGIAVLRCFRLLRIFKLTRYWPLLKQFVTSVGGSLQSIASLLVFLLIFLIIFALLGMVLFGGEYNFDEGRPPFHFDDFPTAIITVFQMTTGKDWPQRMTDGVKSKGGIYKNGMFFAPYFIVVVIFGTYTLLNLFLAIAVDSIATSDEVEITETGQLKRRSTTEEQDDNTSLKENSLEDGSDEATEDDTEAGGGRLTSIPSDFMPDQSEPESSVGVARVTSKSTSEKKTLKYSSELITMPPFSSFFLFKQDNVVRRICFYITSDPVFDYVILATIAASTVALAAEDPVDAKAYTNIALGFLDYGFTAIFTAELLLKMIVLGFVIHPGSYLRDPWNVIDAVVVASAFVSFILEGAGLGGGYATAVKSLRIIRVLRPLKTVRRIPKLQAVLSCIIKSLGKVINVLILFGMFDYIFSCLAIQLFAGRFFYCTDKSKLTEAECVGQFFQFGDKGNVNGVADREWKRWDFNYDNLPNAMLTLFTVTTGDGWPTIMLHSIEATEVNRGPQPAYRQAMAAFYIAFLIICPFFLVNVFVAMIVVTFQEEGADKEIDKNGKRCIDFVVNAKPINIHLPPVEADLRRRVWYLVESTAFEAFIIAFVFLTTIVMMLKHFDQTAGYSEFENIVNFTGALVFAAEALLRIYAYGVLGYFKDIANLFDFFTVSASLFDVIISEINPNLIDIGFLRLFRTVRLIKVMRRIRSIRIILWTFLQSFKALPYVVLLMGMAYFAYAVIGMQLFGNIQLSRESSINENASFQTFFDALLLLFRITTGEGWPDLMLSCTGGKKCSPFAVAESCGNDIGAYIYFMSFILLATFLLLNLFVAVILDNFEFLTRDSSILGPHHLDEFVRSWSDYDPNGTGKITFSDLYTLVKSIEPPLGFGINCPTKMAYRKLIRMNIPLVEGKYVTFTTTLFALVRESLKIKVGDVKEMDAMDKEMRAIITKFWPKYAKRKLHLLMPPEDALGFQQLTTGKIYAGLLLLDLWKNGLEHEAGKYRHDNDNPPDAESSSTVQNLVALANRAATNLALAPILRRPEQQKNNAKAVGETTPGPKRELRFSGINETVTEQRYTQSRLNANTAQSIQDQPQQQQLNRSVRGNLADVPSTSSAFLAVPPQQQQQQVPPGVVIGQPQFPIRLATRARDRPGAVMPLDLRTSAAAAASVEQLLQKGPQGLPYV